MPCHPEDKVVNDGMRRLIDEHEMSESALERDDNMSDIEEMVADNIHSLREAGGIVYSEYVLMKTWVTGEKAVMEEEDIQMELFDLARAWMNDSLLFKVPGQVEGEFDVALWKCFRSYRTRSGSHSFRLFTVLCIICVIATRVFESLPGRRILVCINGENTSLRVMI